MLEVASRENVINDGDRRRYVIRMMLELLPQICTRNSATAQLDLYQRTKCHNPSWTISFPLQSVTSLFFGGFDDASISIFLFYIMSDRKKLIGFGGFGRIGVDWDELGRVGAV